MLTIGEQTALDMGEPFRRLSAEEAHALVEAGNAQVIDVRWRDDYLEGHITGSVNIPLYEILNRRAELRPERHVLLVCEIGVKSALAAEMAATVGCPRVYNIEGGLAAWTKQGYPLDHD